LHQESQQITTLELKIATQKSRIAELEGNLALFQENANKVAKENLVLQERLTKLVREVRE
jgi:uncharacterized coiled-coil protein SlyX